jgi:hypothetical protein
MDHDEDGVGVPRVAKDVLQDHDVAFGDVEVVADADRGVNVHRQVEAAAFANQVAENVVLKSAIFGFGWNAALGVLFVNGLGLLFRGVAEFQRTKVGYFELFSDRALLQVFIEG